MPGVGAPDIAARVCHGFRKGFELEAPLEEGCWLLAAPKKPPLDSDGRDGALC